MPQSIEFLALCCRQAAVAPAGVTLTLCQPVPDRLCRRFELTRQLLRRAAGTHQLNHLAAELRRVRCSCLAHRGLLEPKIVRCPRNRGNFNFWAEGILLVIFGGDFCRFVTGNCWPEAFNST